MKKRKIFNDPVYGFIRIPSEFIFDLISHPVFQRLRRIRQTGLSEYVYPGATHTRFQHALGSMHLMQQTLESLQSKGVLIMDEEKEGALAAILLHDIGHGPFSHTLEYVIFKSISHEQISSLIVEKLNKDFNGRLGYAIQMFENKYGRTFFNQLISSQLDMDRLDYLARDSFYTGVTEGKIGVERIIKMLNVDDNKLYIENKGLLTVESFLLSRRLMYWQVYYHKASLAAEVMLKNLFERLRDLIKEGQDFSYLGNINYFLTADFTVEDLKQNPEILNKFLELDDFDIWHIIKLLSNHNDFVLSNISKNLLNRNLFKLHFFENESNINIQKEISKIEENLPKKEYLKYFSGSGSVSNQAYIKENLGILVQDENKEIKQITEVADLPTIKALSNIVKKEYQYYANFLYL